MNDYLIKITNEDISILQRNLKSLLLIGGWEEEELADYLGVTKQTVWNLQSNKSSMSKLQYFGIRLFVENKIQQPNDNPVLKDVVPLIFRSLDEETIGEPENNNDQVENALKAIAASANSGIRGDSLVPISSSILSGLGVVLPAAGMAALVGLTIWGVMKKR